jgi:hypothetical protein
MVLKGLVCSLKFGSIKPELSCWVMGARKEVPLNKGLSDEHVKQVIGGAFKDSEGRSFANGFPDRPVWIRHAAFSYIQLGRLSIIWGIARGPYITACHYL